MTFDLRKAAFTLAACAAVGATYTVEAQSDHDGQQQVIARIQGEKHAIVLQTLVLDDAQVQAFTPIYDDYKLERKKLFDRASDLLDLYASNYDSMTDEAARKILKEWFALRDDEVALTRKYARRFEKVLPPAKVVRFVQLENKLDTLVQLKAVENVPLAR